ncbi:restriction endonuclease [Ralstonia solanacearum]|uniref:restriction endonuclease n=1 Tax=Ralstonia solanacearum TaxID=305 RepID=UPI0001D950A1|nr:restriction endonuclease [Ralstonia solanacearum]CBJ50893.1 conserved hypothethical protein [Ralstonia solanacearum PSI07]
MLDFKELATDGQDFELLIREILFREGFHVAWSGRGADGGRDLVCTESRQTILGSEAKRWLVQCKHFAHSEKSVGIADLDDIVTSAAQHRCSGYLLACSTFPSSAVVQRLEGIAANSEMRLSTNYWDAVQIERLLATPLMWRIAQRFFPVAATGFEIYATESPNRWVVNYKGYYFHLSNRVGSRAEGHLESIAARVADMEAINLPPDHHLRIRAVYYDDKNGGYVWYLDYLRPREDLATWICPRTSGHRLTLELMIPSCA